MQQDISISNLESEDGFLIMDALVAIVLAAIVALGVMQSTLVAYKYAHQAQAQAIGKELAIEKLEELATSDPETFVDGNQEVENNLTRENITFTRTTDYSIDPDRTRVVTVSVQASRTKIPTQVQLTRSFSLWGER